MVQEQQSNSETAGIRRRRLITQGGLFALVGAFFGGLRAGASGGKKTAENGASNAWPAIQHDYRRMSPAEIEQTIQRIEQRTRQDYGVDIEISAQKALPGVVFGYALNISKCKGVRACVEACVVENNLSRDSPIQYIRVLEMDHGHLDFNHANHYYDAEKVPRKGMFYLPLQCMQCENPPCVKACPVEATWAEPDGIVVIDYDWCIGCRYCMAACPYWARRFNWTKPSLPPEEITRHTHMLGNRPRIKGVMEKCTFCIQRTREGRLPACLEACPTGARIFGNLLDPQSDIRDVLENKTVFRLKEELNTEPKFWYYAD